VITDGQKDNADSKQTGDEEGPGGDVYTVCEILETIFYRSIFDPVLLPLMALTLYHDIHHVGVSAIPD